MARNRSLVNGGFRHNAAGRDRPRLGTSNLINLSPLRHFVEIAYGVQLKGADASMLVLHTAKMALLGAAFFVAGVWRFRRQFR